MAVLILVVVNVFTLFLALFPSNVNFVARSIAARTDYTSAVILKDNLDSFYNNSDLLFCRTIVQSTLATHRCAIVYTS